MKKNILWLRLGDAGEYQAFDGIADALESAEIPAGKVEFLPYGFQVGDYSGRNYISFFWGDEKANPVRELTHAEKEEIKELIGSGLVGL